MRQKTGLASRANGDRMSRLTDQELMGAALRKFKTKKHLARFLGVSAQSVSNYINQYPIPRHVRRILEMELGLEVTVVGEDEPQTWQGAAWRKKREVTKAHEQVQRLFNRTHGEGPAWQAVVNLLDLLEAWAERDWRLIADEGRDWVVAFRPERNNGDDDEGAERGDKQ